jgi:hypothetical protein
MDDLYGGLSPGSDNSSLFGVGPIREGKNEDDDDDEDEDDEETFQVENTMIGRLQRSGSSPQSRYNSFSPHNSGLSRNRSLSGAMQISPTGNRIRSNSEIAGLSPVGSSSQMRGSNPLVTSSNSSSGSSNSGARARSRSEALALSPKSSRPSDARAIASPSGRLSAVANDSEMIE